MAFSTVTLSGQVLALNEHYSDGAMSVGVVLGPDGGDGADIAAGTEILLGRDAVVALGLARGSRVVVDITTGAADQEPAPVAAVAASAPAAAEAPAPAAVEPAAPPAEEPAAEQPASAEPVSAAAAPPAEPIADQSTAVAGEPASEAPAPAAEPAPAPPEAPAA